MVLVALAVFGSIPAQINIGKERSVPPPAMELIAPATRAVAKARSKISQSMLIVEHGILCIASYFDSRRKTFILPAKARRTVGSSSGLSTSLKLNESIFRYAAPMSGMTPVASKVFHSLLIQASVQRWPPKPG